MANKQTQISIPLTKTTELGLVFPRRKMRETACLVTHCADTNSHADWIMVEL